MTKQHYVQKGTISLRAPDGEFVESVPLYEKVTTQTREGEKKILDSAASLFAEVIKSRTGGKDGNKINNQS